MSTKTLTYLIASCISISMCISVSAQEPEVIDSLYALGNKGYGEFMRKNIRYPSKSKMSLTEGLLIYEITVSKEGEVSVRFMTKVDDYIEEMIIPVIQETSRNWLKKEVDYKVYQAIFFTLGYQYAKEFSEFQPGFLKEFKFPYLGSVVVTGISRVSGYNGTSSQYDSKTGAKLKVFNKAKKNLEKYLTKGKLEKAHKSISQMIRYNPFDKSLIQQRRRLEKQMGIEEYRVYDILWLQAMDYIASVQNKKP